MSDTEVLERYRAARDEVLADGFSVSAGDGREWRRDNLPILESLIDKYERRVMVAQSGNILDRARFGAPRRGFP